MTNEKRLKIIDAVAAALRAIGQPDIKNLVFVCETGSRFSEFDEILGIPVYETSTLNVSGGLLLASRESGKKCLGFGLLLEDLLPPEEE